MKNIKFKKLNPNQYYYYFIPLSVLGVYLIFDNPLNLGIRINRVYGFLPILIAILIMNDFFLPINLVEYNEDVVRIKVNSLSKKNIKIEEIESVNIANNELKIQLNNNNSLLFNLNNINSESIKELEKIFKSKNEI